MDNHNQLTTNYSKWTITTSYQLNTQRTENEFKICSKQVKNIPNLQHSQVPTGKSTADKQANNS